MNSTPSSAFTRNRDPIFGVLERLLPAAAQVLEIASGSGEHAAWLAPRLGVARWQPSDVDAQALSRQKAQLAHAGDERLGAPLRLDVTETGWEKTARAAMPVIDAVLAINMVHISPWAACEGLLDGAATLLEAGGFLYLYGPYRQNGAHTAQSNADFDAWLRARNPDWGVRDREAIIAEATRRGFTLTDAVPMPANNLSLIFHRR